MDQVLKINGEWGGASSDHLVCCHDLAKKIFGKACENENGGLIALSYLYRRFGPTLHGSDDHKELCCYWLSSSSPEIILTVSPKGLGLDYCFGYLAKESLRFGSKKQAKASKKITSVLTKAMRDLLRPVFIRDVPVNILGRIKDSDVSREVPYSKYAGYGVPLDEMDKRYAL